MERYFWNGIKADDAGKGDDTAQFCWREGWREPDNWRFKTKLESSALAAYKDFLTLWKNAGPDIPALKQARYEKLR